MATNEQMKALLDQLKEGTKNIFTSGKYTEYLTIMSKFHKYSFRNTLLIHSQNPEASRVAGFGTWKSFGRSVNKGEQGLQILAPAPYKKLITVDHDPQGKPLAKSEEKEVTVTAFKVAYVFDVAQTNGKEIPTLANKLTDDVKSFENIFDSLKKASPFPIEFEDIAIPNCNGYCSPDRQKIAISNGLSQSQIIKTAIHEIAHAMMHTNTDVDRQTAEVQAESVAFITCSHFGIDTSQYSFGYVASWSSNKDLAKLEQSLTVIQNTSNSLISAAEEHLEQKLEVTKEPKKQAEKKPSIKKQLENNKAKIAKGDSDKSPKQTKKQKIEL